MTNDFGVSAGHIAYSNRRFASDTHHMVIIEVSKHITALNEFHYERPVYDQDHPYRARLFLTEDGFKTIRTLEHKGMLTILHHANVVGGYLVDDRKPKRKNARNNTKEDI